MKITVLLLTLLSVALFPSCATGVSKSSVLHLPFINSLIQDSYSSMVLGKKYPGYIVTGSWAPDSTSERKCRMIDSLFAKGYEIYENSSSTLGNRKTYTVIIATTHNNPQYFLSFQFSRQQEYDWVARLMLFDTLPYDTDNNMNP